MKEERASRPARLGIDCGATRSVAIYECGDIRRRHEAGSGNLRLLNDAQLLALYRDASSIHQGMPNPTVVTIGMASARMETDRERIRQFAAKVWPNARCLPTDDLETALAAAELEHGASGKSGHSALIITLVGTGSCFFGKNASGKRVKVGGWGHLLGDKGSAYEIGLRALKATVYYYDCDGKLSLLGRTLMRALMLNHLDEASAWAVNATKAEIAALAPEVFAAALQRDKIARDVLEGAAHSIADDAVTCARRLVKKGGRVKFVFTGSVLLKQPAFARRVTKLIRGQWRNSETAILTREAALGALEIAKKTEKSEIRNPKPDITATNLQSGQQRDMRHWTLDIGLAISPTEQRNPLSTRLDKLPLDEAIALMLREDEKIPAAILAEQKRIERAVKLIVRSLKNRGRLFYVGAGTSGRLGVLDASECPPTFRTDPEMVQGIIAGGQTALWRSVEGAEDDFETGARSLEFRGVTGRDTVVGIAASGRTPFVWGALGEAQRRGATIILVCFNPNLRIPREHRPTLVIAPNVGPEILTGSTRLKAGTATKLILNIFTTLAMVRLGKVLSNLMVDVKPTNTKLRDRAVRIVRTLTGADQARAQTALEQSSWVVKRAVERLGRS